MIYQSMNDDDALGVEDIEMLLAMVGGRTTVIVLDADDPDFTDEETGMRYFPLPRND